MELLGNLCIYKLIFDSYLFDIFFDQIDDYICNILEFQTK